MKNEKFTLLVILTALFFGCNQSTQSPALSSTTAKRAVPEGMGMIKLMENEGVCQAFITLLDADIGSSRINDFNNC